MFERLVIFLVLCLKGGLFATAAGVPGVPQALEQWDGRAGSIVPVPVRNVRVEAGFWGHKMLIYKDRTIPHSWEYMGWELRSLRKASGEKTEGPFNNTWGEANLYKFLETVALSLGIYPDAALEQKVDEIVDLIGRSQRANGYAHVFVINEGKKEWDPDFLDGSHDGHVLGHLIEADYRPAANRFWDSVTHRRMTITGSTGPRNEHEAFGEDYELPNSGYYESCAACGLLDFAQRMFLLEGGSDSGDVLERALYNAVLHGISLDGTTTYYQNPLSDHDHLRDNCWVCCPPNLSRSVFQVGRYAYRNADETMEKALAPSPTEKDAR